LEARARKSYDGKVSDKGIVKIVVYYLNSAFGAGVVRPKAKGPDFPTTADHEVWGKQVDELNLLVIFVVDALVLPGLAFSLGFFLFLLCTFPPPCLLLAHLLFGANTEDLDRAIMRLNGKVRLSRMECNLRDAMIRRERQISDAMNHFHDLKCTQSAKFRRLA
jgi:hypothetical protein